MGSREFENENNIYFVKFCHRIWTTCWILLSGNIYILIEVIYFDIQVIYIYVIHFQIFSQRIVDNIFKDVGWNFDDSMEDDVSLTGIDSTVRVTILEFACAVEKRECLKQAGRIFMNWLTLNKMPHPNIRELIYYYG